MGSASAYANFSNEPNGRYKWAFTADHVLEPDCDEQQLSSTSTAAIRNAVRFLLSPIFIKSVFRNRRNQRGKYPVPKVEPNSHNNFPRHAAQGLAVTKNLQRERSGQERSKESGIVSANTSR